MKIKKIKTDYFGDVEYREEELLTFPDGLFGFEAITRYLPFCLEEDDSSLLLLQAVERPEIAFLAINPVFLLPDYAPRLTVEELNFLGVSDPGELCYYAICVVCSDYLDSSVNLKCPLAINPDTRKGIQVIMSDTPYKYRHRLHSFPELCRAAVRKEEPC